MKAFIIVTLLLVIVIKLIDALALPEINKDNNPSLHDNNESLQMRGPQQFEVITHHENR
ncbi:hypothetical protein C1645_841779, partial [Glomus cerebriforme]